MQRGNILRVYNAKKHGQERGNTLWVNLNAQEAWAGKRKL